MNRPFVIPLFALAVMLAGHSWLYAEEPLPIALVDVDRILKTYSPLQKQLEPLKEEVKKLEEEAQVRQAEIETVASQASKAEPGSPEFQRLQRQHAKLQNEQRQFVLTQRAELEQRQSKLFLAVYRELDQEVRKYAKEHGIKLVLRQQERSLDDNQPLAAILATVNREIIFQDGLDITDTILKTLEDKAASSKAER